MTTAAIHAIDAADVLDAFHRPSHAARPRTPVLRRAHAEDAAAVGRFLQSLSLASRRFRFHGNCDAQSRELALTLCAVDGVRHQAWLAWAGSGPTAVVIGEARFVIGADDAGPGTAELAISVADGWQGSGTADLLMQQVLAAAADAGVRHLHGDVLGGNARMAAFMRRHGFDVDLYASGEVLRMRRELGALHGRIGRAVSRAMDRTLAALVAIPAWLGAGPDAASR